MKQRTLFLLLLSALLLLCACGGNGASLSPEAQKLVGSWGYDHDPETVVLQLRSNGRAVYEEKEYAFACTQERIDLSGGDGAELQLRYEADETGILLYRPVVYFCEGTSDGLAGSWRDAGNRLSFVFTPDGQFSEDDTFSGTFTVDEAAGTFTLHYAGPFDDTTCYFTLGADRLLVEYPWHMVKIK